MAEVPTSRRLLRFITTGGICFSINFAILYAGTELLHLHYAVSLLLSLVVVNWIGLLLNRCWTFEATRNPFWSDALRYWSANALSAVGVFAATALLVEVLHVHYLLANVLLAVLFLFGNFIMHKSWTFRARAARSSPDRRSGTPSS
jgi:putative flippase GtrA